MRNQAKSRERKTYHEGANDERSAALAVFRRDLRAMKARLPEESSLVLIAYIERKIRWFLRRNERYDVRAGGLGKK